MKKITKLLVVVLSLALLVGAVIGITAAADGPGNDKWVVSSNVSYGDNIYPYIAVDSTLATEPSKLSIKVGGDPYAANKDIMEKFFPVTQENVDIYEKDPEKAGSVIAHVIDLPGVAAKNMGDNIYISVWYDGEEVESITYSVAQYFFERLYKNGVADEEGTQKNLYLASLDYGAKAELVLRGSLAAAEKLSNKIYVQADPTSGLTSGITLAQSTITLPEGLWSVKSYANPGVGAVQSYVDAGTYELPGSVVIEQFIPQEDEVLELPYADFNHLEAGTVIASGATNTLADPMIPTGHGGNEYHGYAGTGFSATILEENGEKYLSLVDADTNGSRHFRFGTRQAPATNDPLVFEAQIRVNTTSGRHPSIMFYGTLDTSVQKGTYRVLYTSGNDVYFGPANEGKVIGKGLANKWFTLRLVIGSDDTLNVYVNGVHQSAVSGTNASISACRYISFSGNNKTDTNTYDIKKVYFGHLPEANIPYVNFNGIEVVEGGTPWSSGLVSNEKLTITHKDVSGVVSSTVKTASAGYNYLSIADTGSETGFLNFTTTDAPTADSPIVFDAIMSAAEAGSSQWGGIKFLNETASAQSASFVKFNPKASSLYSGWMHLQIVIDANDTLTIYKNGAQVYTETKAGISNTRIISFTANDKGAQATYNFFKAYFGSELKLFVAPPVPELSAGTGTLADGGLAMSAGQGVAIKDITTNAIAYYRVTDTDSDAGSQSIAFYGSNGTADTPVFYVKADIRVYGLAGLLNPTKDLKLGTQLLWFRAYTVLDYDRYLVRFGNQGTFSNGAHNNSDTKTEKVFDFGKWFTVEIKIYSPDGSNWETAISVDGKIVTVYKGAQSVQGSTNTGIQYARVYIGNNAGGFAGTYEVKGVSVEHIAYDAADFTK
ncbi:MAG: hypothetical protein J6Q85_08250 [Clostridia bacterium]|nr:hypothetical protein [Clostridia bacterium]